MIINEKEINYIEYGKRNGQTIVLLHGWGQNIEMMKPLGEFFKEKYRVVIIDLPGHGKSSIPDYAYTVYDYVALINKLLKLIKVENPIIIGHSFGGKIAMLFASMHKVDKLILLGSPFKKEIKKLSLKTKLLKFAKKIPILNMFEEYAKTKIGSVDYRAASPIMRDILVNTVNLDITEVLQNITSPTLAIWGTKDEAVAIESAYELEKLIPNCGVIAIEGASHYAYLEHLSYVIKIINSLLEEN